MKLLLDTQAFVWWITDDRRLSGKARAAIAKPRNQVAVSVASAWELAIKSLLGRTGGPLDPYLVEREADVNGFEVMPILLRHAVGTASLPPIHADPFDRMLISQARAEGFSIVSADRILADYPIRVVW